MGLCLAVQIEKKSRRRLSERLREDVEEMAKRKRGSKAKATDDEAEMNFRKEQRSHPNQNAGRGQILIPMVC